MTKNNYIMPEQCRNCGAVFDLWYNFSEESADMEEAKEKLGKRVSEYLCWDCKKQIITELSIKDEKDEESSEDELMLDWDIE